jgi:hypothetical protein
MEGEAPEQPQQSESKPQEVITSEGIQVRLTKGEEPQEVTPTLYDKTGKPVPPQIIGEVVDITDKP